MQLFSFITDGSIVAIFARATIIVCVIVYLIYAIAVLGQAFAFGKLIKTNFYFLIVIFSVLQVVLGVAILVAALLF